MSARDRKFAEQMRRYLEETTPEERARWRRAAESAPGRGPVPPGFARVTTAEGTFDIRVRPPGA